MLLYKLLVRFFFILLNLQRDVPLKLLLKVGSDYNQITEINFNDFFVKHSEDLCIFVLRKKVLMVHLAGPYRFNKLGNQKPPGEILGYKCSTEEPQG